MIFVSKTHATTIPFPAILRHACACRYTSLTPTEFVFFNAFDYQVG